MHLSFVQAPIRNTEGVLETTRSRFNALYLRLDEELKQ
jgi:hypothetical protein